jgi:hypothetical protein
LISACVSFDNLTRASVLFVIADAAGMSIGPMLAAILDTFSGRDIDVNLSLPFLPAGGLIYNNVTSPGYIMSVLWFIELMALVFLFQEPARLNDDEDSSGIANSHRESSDDNRPVENGDGTTPLQRKGYGSIVSQDSSLAQSESVSIIKLIFKNPALPLTIVLFGYIEMTCEILISSCSMVVRRYFGWHGNRAGLLLACLGALVLPAHFVVEKASHYYSERGILFVSLVLKYRAASLHQLLTLFASLRCFSFACASVESSTGRRCTMTLSVVMKFPTLTCQTQRFLTRKLEKNISLNCSQRKASFVMNSMLVRTFTFPSYQLFLLAR